MQQTFKKYEKLCKKAHIDYLYRKGHSLYYSPFIIKWTLSPVSLDNSPCQVLFIVPKRLFKRAVQRNRKKRLARECYRMTKSDFYKFLSENNLQIIISIAYSKIDDLNYKELEESFRQIFNLIIKDILKRVKK